ncbi:nucleic-acid-binding protein containing a zn-ribbon [Novosphingobium sp. Rr 2-17]|uniref:Zn-ribbon domain-containing OB-fold protein n=1 Tax=Novosphingobium sp. Rr 2-17 TaxID=555793 RepID=UPI0002697B9B|nr:OB-fold domain-containing protein [Novosphingobium sp. Rr 2-17]EIZ78327.1 nucleic-acid-binding protein containing a zn-ribbon [Novosphingobium sp. Rr 2-17]
MSEHTASPALPTPIPYISPETAPFWAAAREHRLVLPVCTECETHIWYPKAFCSACGSMAVEWRDMSGLGTIYSFTQVHRGEGPYREVPSFVLALVDLDEGARVLTNIVEADPADLRIGQPVQVVFHEAGEAAALPRFKPAT